jgi:hypothetical protein
MKIAKTKKAKGRVMAEALRTYLARPNASDIAKRTYRECLIEALVKSAMGGDTGAAKEILDHVDGKVPHSVEGAGSPVNINFVWGSPPQWMNASEPAVEIGRR